MSNDLALDREGYAIFVSEVQELLAGLTAIVKRPREKIDLHDLQRFTHTLKGVLAVYALDNAVAAAHQMESQLQALVNGGKTLTKTNRLELQKATQKVGKQIVSGLRKLSAGIKRPVRRTAQALNRLEVEPPLLIPIPADNGTADVELNIPTLYEKAERPKHTTVSPVLKKYLDTADVLAHKLGKKIDIHISGSEVPLPQKGMTLLFANVLHLISNAIDHGIETPAKRLEKGKPERGSLKIMARRYQGRFVLCIADDGAGIDTHQVREIAVSRGLISQAAATCFNKDDFVNLIFLPGFSLRKRISTISGRGIGMDSVKDAVEKHQGRMEIKTILGKGTAIKILIPYRD